MKKIHFEILISILFVFISTFFIYGYLSKFSGFWDSQTIWSCILGICWIIVSLGYYNQGHLVQKSKSANHVSIILPIAVFVVQCVLFVKGIHYKDWSLVGGAIIVNSGVLFSLYQIYKVR